MHYLKPYPSSVEQKVAHCPGLLWSWAKGGPGLPRWWVFPLAWPLGACGEKAKVLPCTAAHKGLQEVHVSGTKELWLILIFSQLLQEYAFHLQGRGGVVWYSVLRWSFPDWTKWVKHWGKGLIPWYSNLSRKFSQVVLPTYRPEFLTIQISTVRLLGWWALLLKGTQNSLDWHWLQN